MRGFCERAILVFMKIENYEALPPEQRNRYLHSIKIFVKYLRAIGITPACFVTDEVAHKVSLENVVWLNPLNQGDMFFISRNCEGMQNIDMRGEYLSDLIQESVAKYPCEQGVSLDTRFECILKRDSFVTSRYLLKAPLVVAFSRKTTCNYSIKIKEGKQHIRIFLTASMTLECYLAGKKIDANRLLNLNNGRYPVYEWEGGTYR